MVESSVAMESIEQTFNGTVGFGKKVTCTVSRNGDLIHKVYLQADLPALSSSNDTYISDVGHALIKEVTVEIGGQQIDKHYGEWLQIWSELTLPAEKETGYNKMIDGDWEGNTVYVPLQFWFNRNPGLALPLIALQYHEVKFNITFDSADHCVSSGSVASGGDLSGSLYVDYIYLDTDERRQFAQVQHEYLIEQLQFTGAESLTSGGSAKSKLAFNHPVKELIWVIQADGNAPNEYTGSFGTAKLQLNGHDRFSERKASYFNLVQPYQHHTRIPSSNVYVYSFALHPEQHQPSGTVNMSRIDNATLHLGAVSGSSPSLHTYAVNYNVLRIMAGINFLLCQTVSCLMSFMITYQGKQWKVMNQFFELVI